MIKSMTGFGRERVVNESREILVEIRSVNHRYYEFSAKTPRAYGYLEEKLKEFLKTSVSRGKIEVSVLIYNQEGVNAQIEINKELAKGYLNALRGAKDELELEDDLTLARIMRLPDIFTVVKQTEDEEAIWNEVKEVAQVALDRFVEMRVTEGERMYADINSRLNYLEQAVTKIEEQSPSVTKAYEERLYAKIKDTLGDREIDDQRIVTEVAIFADKTAVDEETVRLRSHLEQMDEMLRGNGGIGRKLDFLLQEMNREANTTGSKCSDVKVARIVVDIKAELEKIREQTQNIE